LRRSFAIRAATRLGTRSSVQHASSAAREKRISLHQVAVATPEIARVLSADALTAALDERAATANCGLLVDRLKEIERAG
jgi:hypothetical protein